MSKLPRSFLLLFAAMVLTLGGSRAAKAYEFSSGAAAACPECTTAEGQSQAAEIAETLSLDGPVSSSFGSPGQLTDAIEAQGADAAEGAAQTTRSLLSPGVVEAAVAESPAGKFWGPVGMAVDAFATGFIIGTEGRMLYLKIFGGHAEVSTGSLSPTDSRWMKCDEREGCSLTPFVGGNETNPAEKGEYLLAQSIGGGSDLDRTSWTATEYLADCYGGPPSDCQTTVHMGPAGYASVSKTRAVERNRCTISGCYLNPGSEAYLITPRKTITFVRTYRDFIEDHDTRVRTFTGSAPTPVWGNVPAVAEPRTQTESLSALDAAMAAHPGFGNAVGIEIAVQDAAKPGGDGTDEDEDKCGVAGDPPRYEDPGLQRGSGDFLENPTSWRARYDTVSADEYRGPNEVFPTTGVPAAGGTVHMRWGFTYFNTTYGDWRGWGYRKIVAKHGWGPEALTNTTEALSSGAPVPTNEYTGYLGSPYPATSGDQTCRWLVVVQHQPDNKPNSPELDEQVPMGNIITAFGLRVSGA